MNNFIETKRYKIKLLSPLHIGTGNKIPFFMIYCGGGYCYIFNEIKFGEELSKRGPQIVDRFIQFSSRERGQLSDFIKEIFRGNTKGLNDFVEKTKAYKIKARQLPQREIIPFVRNSSFQPFVPGTSIKGALRTAIMYSMLKKMEKPHRERILVDYVRDKIESLQDRIKRGEKVQFYKEEKYFDKDLEVKLMWEYSLSENTTKFDPHTDIMRAVKISDTQPLDPDIAVLEEVEVYTGNFATGIKIYAETLPEGTELEFSITFNLHLFDRIRRHTSNKFELAIEEITEIARNPLETLNTWASDLLEYERKNSKNQIIYSFREEPNLNLGWGGGLLTKTVDLFLPESLRAELLSFFKRRKAYMPAPASRKLTSSNRPMGWCKVEKLQ